MVAPLIAAGARAAAGAAGRGATAGRKVAMREALSRASKASLRHSARVPTYIAAFMLTVALLLDFLGVFVGLIPIIGIMLLTKLITIIAVPLFGVWFALCGVTLLSGERVSLKVLSMMAGIVIETVPILDLLPGIFAGVLGILIANRLETRGTGAATPKPRPQLRWSGPQKMPAGEART